MSIQGFLNCNHCSSHVNPVYEAFGKKEPKKNLSHSPKHGSKLPEAEYNSLPRFEKKSTTVQLTKSVSKFLLLPFSPVVYVAKMIIGLFPYRIMKKKNHSYKYRYKVVSKDKIGRKREKDP
jgi:hypothetical protein